MSYTYIAWKLYVMIYLIEKISITIIQLTSYSFFKRITAHFNQKFIIIWLKLISKVICNECNVFLRLNVSLNTATIIMRVPKQWQYDKKCRNDISWKIMFIKNGRNHVQFFSNIKKTLYCYNNIYEKSSREILFILVTWCVQQSIVLVSWLLDKKNCCSHSKHIIVVTFGMIFQ